jgi:hypothetical protein
MKKNRLTYACASRAWQCRVPERSASRKPRLVQLTTSCALET